jgi:hypothetical protein
MGGLGEYVFAVCEGDQLTLPAQLVADFGEGITLAQSEMGRTGKQYGVWVLKTPDWHGLCGNCGEPWKPYAEYVEGGRQLIGHGNDLTATGSKGGC